MKYEGPIGKKMKETIGGYGETNCVGEGEVVCIEYGEGWTCEVDLEAKKVESKRQQ